MQCSLTTSASELAATIHDQYLRSTGSLSPATSLVPRSVLAPQSMEVTFQALSSVFFKIM
ncbi:hypothetical protein GQ55_9G340700 [Panicum hallii var. hallii]|uniref:Uncharacterized protein n=1 Tax=Panicum hallii var. hallii TaxID=1504633 RepID=A0A2T7C8N5_9POAL|nr:hypothetical protein GQ55_9G340700 [Panicum hallii var. hallii]PUZ39613.1 hypothetical protein GQ55_9G340700 [Panicum hallii var. hallii]